jgi:hypothetical protein
LSSIGRKFVIWSNRLSINAANRTQLCNEHDFLANPLSLGSYFRQRFARQRPYPWHHKGLPGPNIDPTPLDCANLQPAWSNPWHIGRRVAKRGTAVGEGG